MEAWIVAAVIAAGAVYLWNRWRQLARAHYDAFCRRAFGGFLHHTPAVVLSRDRQNNSGLRLFALDSKLGIADGFVYSPDCKRRATSDGSVQVGVIYCGGDFSDTSFDGSTDGCGGGGD